MKALELRVQEKDAQLGEMAITHAQMAHQLHESKLQLERHVDVCSLRALQVLERIVLSLTGAIAALCLMWLLLSVGE